MNRTELNIEQLRETTNPYTVPEGYFEQQERDLLSIASRGRRTSVLPLFVSVAASVAVIASLAAYLLFADRNTGDLDLYIASLSDADLNESIALDDLDTYSEFILADEL